MMHHQKNFNREMNLDSPRAEENQQQGGISLPPSLQESTDAVKSSSTSTNKVVPSSTNTVKKEGKKWDKNGFGFPKLPLGIKYKEIIIFLCWIAAIGFTIWFIYDVVNHYLHALHNPITALSLVEHIPMAFPAITVCNYNALKHCDTCGLTLEHATRVLDNGSVIDYETHYESTVIGDFHCIVINNDTHHPIPEATLTGYGASYSLFFKVPKMPSNTYSRYGLQISFHKQGTVPDVLSETNFAMAGVDNFFILTKYHTKYLDTHESSSSSESGSATTTHSIRSAESSGGDSSSSSSTSKGEEMRWVSLFSLPII